MPDLIEKSQEASTWMAEALAAHAGRDVFGRLASAVIWSNATDANGRLLVPVDPVQLASKINAEPFPLLLGHDPGRPMGQVISAKTFGSPPGEVFVAAVLGFYEGGRRLGFGDLGLDVAAAVSPPADLPPLPAEFRLQLAVDPRERDEAWLESLVREAPFPIDMRDRSNNAAEASHTFMTVAVLFVALVWSPLVATLTNEMGKDAYAALRTWLKKLSAQLAEHRDPLLEVQSFHEGCCISFMFRSRDVARLNKAHDALPGSAVRAAHLVAQMEALALAPVRLVYEFHPTQDLWHPSYAELADGRLVSDNAELIALERLPTGLSLGIMPETLLEGDAPPN
ncbi:MAG: hypothetical protein QM688_01315 [Sphingomonas bacterium]